MREKIIIIIIIIIILIVVVIIYKIIKSNNKMVSGPKISYVIRILNLRTKLGSKLI